MEIFRFNILPLEEVEKREAFKAAVNKCPYCETTLQFNVEIDFMQNAIKEECFCPQCNQQVRIETHGLQ